MSASSLSRVGVVAIGRNEGERLRQCLAALPREVGASVYVDSGSTDESCTAAREAHVDVVNLDMSQPFTAARARNAGVARLLQLLPTLEFVQFIDGDCSFAPGWVARATQELVSLPEVTAVTGRLYELYPERSVYNRLAELGWASTHEGEVEAFGGIVMIRLGALQRVGGWNACLIAGEDPELSIRIRKEGGKIRHLGDPMAYHDAAMTHFCQWWQRATRTGHAYAQVAAMHGDGSGRYFEPQTRRSLLWGVAIPAISVALSLPTAGASLLLLGVYPAQVVRITLRERARGKELSDAVLWGVACVVGRFAEARGALRYYTNRLRKRQSTLIEYKGAAR